MKRKMLMKRNLLLISSTAAVLAAMSVVAQPHGGLLRLDTNGDGQVSREEFQPPAGRGGSRLFKRADADRDGNLTRDEMLASIDASAERQGKRRESLPQMFDAMDSDGNGVVTSLEAQNHAFVRLDANGDGFLSETEAKAMREKRGQRRGRNEDSAIDDEGSSTDSP